MGASGELVQHASAGVNRPEAGEAEGVVGTPSADCGRGGGGSTLAPSRSAAQEGGFDHGCDAPTPRTRAEAFEGAFAEAAETSGLGPATQAPLDPSDPLENAVLMLRRYGRKPPRQQLLGLELQSGQDADPDDLDDGAWTCGTCLDSGAQTWFRENGAQAARPSQGGSAAVSLVAVALWRAMVGVLWFLLTTVVLWLVTLPLRLV